MTADEARIGLSRAAIGAALAAHVLARMVGPRHQPRVPPKDGAQIVTARDAESSYRREAHRYLPNI